MFGSLRPADTAVMLDVEYPRIFRIAEKIARGLEFVTAGVAYRTQLFSQMLYRHLHSTSSRSSTWYLNAITDLSVWSILNGILLAKTFRPWAKLSRMPSRNWVFRQFGHPVLHLRMTAGAP